jgi:hypothetical protein
LVVTMTPTRRPSRPATASSMAPGS